METPVGGSTERRSWNTGNKSSVHWWTKRNIWTQNMDRREAGRHVSTASGTTSRSTELWMAIEREREREDEGI